MPKATLSKSTMSFTNGTPRATTPRSIRRDRDALDLMAIAPRFAGAFLFVARHLRFEKVDPSAALRSSAPAGTRDEKSPHRHIRRPRRSRRSPRGGIRRHGGDF